MKLRKVPCYNNCHSDKSMEALATSFHITKQRNFGIATVSVYLPPPLSLMAYRSVNDTL